MLIQHEGKRPRIAPSAWIASTAVVSGAVTVAPNARILHGAVVTAEMGGEIAVGEGCVIMEQAVLRSSGRFPLRLGRHVLVGPHSYLTGCTVEARSFIATGAMVFNGAVVGEASVVALDGKVHVDTELPRGGRVPMGHIAFGRPAHIYPPAQAPEVHDRLDREIGFMRYVFGVELEGRPRGEIMDEAITKYATALTRHADDSSVE
jgi:carbonic anhydrase/acetyltransferase-like protein (isoleucine patch superfamily)